jgi:hypothetical protein
MARLELARRWRWMPDKLQALALRKTEMNALYDGSIEPDGVTGVWNSRSLCIIDQLERSCSKCYCHTSASTGQIMTREA